MRMDVLWRVAMSAAGTQDAMQAGQLGSVQRIQLDDGCAIPSM